MGDLDHRAGDGGPGGPLKAADDMQRTTVTAVTAVALLCRYSINALASSTPSRIKADFVRRSHKAVLSLVGFRILGAGCFSGQSQPLEGVLELIFCEDFQIRFQKLIKTSAAKRCFAWCFAKVFQDLQDLQDLQNFVQTLLRPFEPFGASP